MVMFQRRTACPCGFGEYSGGSFVGAKFRRTMTQTMIGEATAVFVEEACLAFKASRKLLRLRYRFAGDF